MEKIGFIGAYDKIDFIIQIAKILVELEKKVIVIDSTKNQKAKYIVPTISPSISYVTEYEGIDVSVGLYSFEDIEQYLGETGFETMNYDYVLIDVDDPDMLEGFELYNANHNYFVTSFDLYSLKRGIEILSGIQMVIPLTKVLFSQTIFKEDDEYLNFLALGRRIEWNEERIYFPLNSEDQNIITGNQRIAKVKFKGLSNSYKEALMFITEEIVGSNEHTNIKRIFKQI